MIGPGTLDNGLKRESFALEIIFKNVVKQYGEIRKK
jgi:hypothetical protein